MSRLLVLICLLVGCQQVSWADGCGQFFTTAYRQQYYTYSYAQPVYYYKPIYYYPPVQYRAGVDIEAESIAEKVSRRLKEELRAEQLLQQQQQQQGSRLSGALAAKCASCHNATKASGGLVLDGSTIIDDYYFRRISEVLNGIDVPPPMQRVISSMTPDDKGAVFLDMLAMKPGGAVPVSTGSQHYQAPPQQAPQEKWAPQQQAPPQKWTPPQQAPVQKQFPPQKEYPPTTAPAPGREPELDPLPYPPDDGGLE